MCCKDEDAKEDEFEYLVVVIIIMTKQLVCFCSF
jgi:hypothetical protein